MEQITRDEIFELLEQSVCPNLCVKEFSYKSCEFCVKRKQAIVALEALELVAEGWDAQAYATMRDEIEYWKNRAAELDVALERMANDMAPTHMGEPVLNVSRDHQADAWLRVVGLLNELSPGWIIQEGINAEEAALKTIRELTASPAPDQNKPEFPSVLFDGYAVLNEVNRRRDEFQKGEQLTPLTISEVLDAVVRIIKREEAAPRRRGW